MWILQECIIHTSNKMNRITLTIQLSIDDFFELVDSKSNQSQSNRTEL